MRWILPYDEDVIRKKCYIDSFPPKNLMWTEEEIRKILSYACEERLFQKMIMGSIKIFKQINQ